MYSSAFKVSGPQGPDEGGGGSQTFIKTFLGQVGMCVQIIIKIGAWVWISISRPHTNRHTHIQTNICAPIYT